MSELEPTAIKPSNVQVDEDPALIMARRFGINTTTTGAAFSGWFKAITLAIVASIAYWAYQALPTLAWHALSNQARWILGGCIGLVLYTLYWIMVSRTTVSPTEIDQTFVFNRRVHLGEVTLAKFVYIPYLTWLIAPRLYVRTASNKFHAIYGASHALHQVFGQIHRTVAQGSK